jgi:hypothetical protein
LKKTQLKNVKLPPLVYLEPVMNKSSKSIRKQCNKLI